MFTGLIQDVGAVVTFTPRGKEASLTVRTGLDLGRVSLGDSIAVDGACLTVTELGQDRFSAVLSEETLRRTTFQDMVPGQRVNLEAALRMGDALGGHMVQGHVDGVGEFLRSETIEDGWDLTYRIPSDLLDTVVEKGSIAIDGVSLTVARLENDEVTIAVIPHTGEKTNLLDRQPGARINVETDMIGKYVRRYLTRMSAAGLEPDSGS